MTYLQRVQLKTLSLHSMALIFKVCLLEVLVSEIKPFTRDLVANFLRFTRIAHVPRLSHRL